MNFVENNNDENDLLIKNLIEKNKEYEKDVQELKEVIYSVLRLMNLFDEETKTIKASIKNGSESYSKHVFKAFRKIMALVMESELGVKSAKEELLQQFAFIKNLIPIIEKHG